LSLLRAGKVLFERINEHDWNQLYIEGYQILLGEVGDPARAAEQIEVELSRKI
jgi:hypothetical protein